MTEIERLILTKLGKGRRWARAFQSAKPVVDRLVERGLVRRVKPEGGQACNMLEITHRGQDALEAIDG